MEMGCLLHAWLEANTVQELFRKLWRKDEFLFNAPDDTSPPGCNAVSNGGPKYLYTFRRILLHQLFGVWQSKKSESNKFKDCKSVHHHTIPINQPTRCNNFPSLLLDVYVRFNMIWASSRPPSGAQQLQ
jgi:hypothetical protein